jgi:hypothetical protein
MNKPLPPLHHSLILTSCTDVHGKEGETAWTMEFTVFRSENGFQRRAEWIGIFEQRGNTAAELRRKVFRKTFPFPEHLENPESLFSTPWQVEGMEFSGTHWIGKVSLSEGDLSWNLDLGLGHQLDYQPLSRWLNSRTLRTQIPLKGFWKLETRRAEGAKFEWSSSESPARAILQKRVDSLRIWPTIWFHAQGIHDPSKNVDHCAEGLHGRPNSLLAPPLTSISAFESLKGLPQISLWRALRSSMTRTSRGWTFRTEQEGRELRGRIEVEPKHWVTLSREDVRGRPIYRTSTRMARLEVLLLERGKPLGFFTTGLDTWLEWTTFRRPSEFPEIF